MENTLYKVRCYKRNGDFDHEEKPLTFDEAKKRRTEWGLKIGLRPEPSIDFAYYPTIWKWQNKSWHRVEGY